MSLRFLPNSFAFIFDDAAGGSLWNNPLLWKWINLLIFLAVMIYILRNKIGIGNIFKARAQRITEEIKESRREKLEAEAHLAEVEARLARLDQEVTAIKAEAEAEARKEAGRIREEANADAEKIRQMAHSEIEGAMVAARQELRAFIAEHSINMAETAIQREIKPDDNKRILTRYMEEISEVNK